MNGLSIVIELTPEQAEIVHAWAVGFGDERWTELRGERYERTGDRPHRCGARAL